VNRKALIAWLLCQAGACSAAAVAVPAATDDAANAGVAHAPSVADASAARERAIERARTALRAAGFDPAAMTLTSARAVTWPDSSLGCRRPGIQYLMVQSAGYRVAFSATPGDYEVHVAGARAIVCVAGRSGLTRLGRPLAPVRNLDLMTRRATEMLAGLIHASAAQIRVLRVDPQVWPDTALGCASTSAPVPGRISGFRIVLAHAQREYAFNTDLHRVIACPPIDVQ
jgi:hypothetical protein